MNQVAERTPLLIASEINSIKQQTQRMLLLNSIEIGRRLVEAKSLIPYGEWGRWLDETVDYSKSTANNLMKIFEEYGDSQLSLFGSEAKSQALGKLTYTQAVALLGVPEPEREQFVKENDVENKSTRELQKIIKEKQELQRKLDESEKLAKKEKEAKEKLKKQFEDLDKQNKAYTEQIDQLKEDIESAVTNGNQEEVAGLEASLKDKESELKASTDKIKDLEKLLKNKPIEVPAVVEKVPPDVEKELAELRKLAQQNDKSVVKFSVAFEALVKNFGDLLGSLNNIQDPAEQERYRNAVGALIDKMKERL